MDCFLPPDPYAWGSSVKNATLFPVGLNDILFVFLHVDYFYQFAYYQSIRISSLMLMLMDI